jgi:hypothetical protein
MRIVVSGTMTGVPRQGGATWAVLQYALGFQRLGHRVVLVEQVADLERVSRSFRSLVRSHGLEGVLLEEGSDRRLEVGAVCPEGAELLINISGALRDERVLATIDTRVFLDLDPAFTQLWHEVDGIDLGFERHNRFATIGRGLGTSATRIPDCGRRWLTVTQPVVLHRWPVGDSVWHAAATSVGHWRSYGSIEHEGVHYGQRAHAARRLLSLPSLSSVPVRLALGIDPAERDDVDALRRNGWQLVDPNRVAGTPAAYRAFIRGSWAELGIAKSGYVAARCGWFSDRSVCYLASGRPVVAQQTGFSDWLPTGDGLFAYESAEEAAAALDSVRADYPRHRRAARALAEDVFASDRVLKDFLACL